MTTKNIAALLFGTMILAASLQAADFVHPRLKEKEVVLKTAIMLPPMVTMSKSGVKGKEGMGKEEEAAIADYQSGVITGLKFRGMDVDAPFTQEVLSGNDELRSAVADVQKRFDEIAAQLFKKHKDVRKGRFTLGDSVAVLNTKGTADALVIIRAMGLKQTKGKSFMTGGLVGKARSGTSDFQSHVAVVDAKNGVILFLGEYTSHGLPKEKTYEKSFLNITGKK